MRLRILLAIGCLMVPAIALTTAWTREAGQVNDTQPPMAAPKDDFANEVVPFLNRHCTKCHGGEKPKAGVDLSKFKDAETAGKHRSLWENVIHQLKAGEMPPAGRAPGIDERLRVINILDSTFLNYDCTKPRDPGRVTSRRLSKDEYNNTIRDLLGVNFKPAADFPDDDILAAFPNNGDVLGLDPLLMEKYFVAAEKIVDRVFNNPALLERIITKPLPGGPPGPGQVPVAKLGPKEKGEAFKAVMEPFLRRAYRRPVATDELNRYTKFIALAEKNGDGLEKALQLAMQAALCSPNFLFRVEKDFVIQGDVISQPIGPYELASRLSYFLWASMPDDELLAAAGKGTLRDKKGLEDQVRRLLKDPKSATLAEIFAGRWFQLTTVARLTPDPKIYPHFNSQFAADMVKETELFVDHLIRDNRSILEVLDANWTFLNERLAKHYGIPGVQGDEFRKVKLTGEQRIGVLTHASVLSVTSNPTRTSPTKRAKWILDNILNTPPPPPPPDVSGLGDEPTIVAGPQRNQMEMHRANPFCAGCHQRIDPLGFGFENFDAIGGWRTMDGDFKIDPSGVLPDGQKFQNTKELVAILRKKDAEFRRCLAEKLLEYGLGRGLQYFDKCAVDDICADSVRNDDRFVSVILAIVNSDPFQKRKGR